jgi:myo-inositol-1(or 4)-monophosphatase
MSQQAEVTREARSIDLADLELAERAAREAGQLLLARFGRPAADVDRKSSSTDMVSEADRVAESAIASLLERERPDDGVLAEEGARADGSTGRRWVVDPLDGTTNFLYEIPQWAVSVAVEDGDGVAAGVVRDPVRDETFAAARGAGATLNGEPIALREPPRLARALIATGFSYDRATRAVQAETLLGVLPHVRDIRRAGAASLDLAWLAAGRLDGYYERGLKPWDWAAGRLLVLEAGGAVAELDGDPSGLAAATPELLPQLLALLPD